MICQLVYSKDGEGGTINVTVDNQHVKERVILQTLQQKVPGATLLFYAFVFGKQAEGRTTAISSDEAEAQDG